MSSKQQELAGLIWSVADLLRGDFKASEYRRVILPFVVLRRLDCVLEPSKAEVLDTAAELGGQIVNLEPLLCQVSGEQFYNLSPLTMTRLLDDPTNIAGNLRSYTRAFSSMARDVLDKFDLSGQIDRLDRAGLLYLVISRFCEIDLHPGVISNLEMGDLYEELIRRFSELSNEEAGEHFTPREVIRLMVNLLLIEDDKLLTQLGAVKTMLDPACGTGGMLSMAEEHVRSLNPHARLKMYGQELNAETYAICRSNMMLKGQDASHITYGNSFSEDHFEGERFDYLLANPPFGVEWKRVEAEVRREAETKGFNGRFGAGLPRINDGSFLFLQHMIAHMKPVAVGGSRIAIIFNGSPLFNGGAGSGESNIRRWIIENDWLEAVVALPDQLFYNTGISTYFWVVTNRKTPERRGKVILLDARDHWTKMRHSLGNKRKYISNEQIAELIALYNEATTAEVDSSHSGRKVSTHDLTDFGYQRIVIERPLRLRFEVTHAAVAQVETAKSLAKFYSATALLDALRALVGQTWLRKADFESDFRVALAKEGVRDSLPIAVRRAVLNAASVADTEGEIQTEASGAVVPDPELRSEEKVPLAEDITAFEQRDVIPHTSDAWVDHSKTKIGYEIPRMLFFATRWGERFEPLEKVARQVVARQIRGAAELQLPLLRARDLQSIDFATELSEFPAQGDLLAPCSDGDVVGSAGNWRLLPEGFGSALTSLKVLRPLGHTGRALCEWLNSAKMNEYGRGSLVPASVAVPIAAITDPEFDQLLKDLHDGRRILGRTTSRILPNIFRDSINDLEDVRRIARSMASEARLIDDLVRPIDDPLWRAEWSYPYHVAALARLYRIAVTPEARKDGILKLGEGIARNLGILALAVLIRRRGLFSSELRHQFHNGATFGMWLKIIKHLQEAGAVPEIRELDSVLDPGGTYEMLHKLHDYRNDSHHAHGMHSRYQLQEEIGRLEPILMSALESVGWLSGVRWELVEQCQFIGSGNQLIGEWLRGSHPDWEPFTRFSVEQVAPNRIYVESPSSGISIDLWPIAIAEHCTACRARELFLLDRVKGKTLVLRSLRNHTIDRNIG